MWNGCTRTSALIVASFVVSPFFVSSLILQRAAASAISTLLLHKWKISLPSGRPDIKQEQDQNPVLRTSTKPGSRFNICCAWHWKVASEWIGSTSLTPSRLKPPHFGDFSGLKEVCVRGPFTSISIA